MRDAEDLANMIRSLGYSLWELVCSGDSRLDPDDVIQVLESHGLHCPEPLKEK